MTIALKYISPADDMMPTIKKTISSFAAQILADGNRMCNRDGTPTKYGDLRPGMIQGPVRNLALALIYRLWYVASNTQQAYDLWKNIAKKYGKEFDKTETHFLWKHAYYNDHLAFLANTCYALLVGPEEDGGKEVREGLKRLLYKTRKYDCPYFHYLAHLVKVESPYLNLTKADSLLAEWRIAPQHPNGKTCLETINSTDPSIKTVKIDGQLRAASPLPIWKRPSQDFFWQRGPFDLDGFIGYKNEECYQHNGLDFLVSYYLRQIGKS
jgi:hypothetical protein